MTSNNSLAMAPSTALYYRDGAVNILLTALPRDYPMSRPPSPDMLHPWKLQLPATLAGKVEYLLHDPIHLKPIYSARGKLVQSLLEWWLAREEGRPLPHVPSLEELRTR